METYESRAENHYNYHHLECLFSEGSIHNYYTKTRESNIATLLRQNNIAKYSKDCLCVLESPYFCLVFRCILHLEDEWQYQFCKGHLVAKKLGAKDLSVTFFHKMGQKVPYGKKVCICLQAEKKEAQMRCRKSRPFTVREKCK